MICGHKSSTHRCVQLASSLGSKKCTFQYTRSLNLKGRPKKLFGEGVRPRPTPGVQTVWVTHWPQLLETLQRVSKRVVPNVKHWHLTGA